MSTLPHDPVDTAKVDRQTAISSAARCDLAEVVREFDAAAKRFAAAHPARADLSDLFRKVVAFTTELFPGDMSVETRVDPEIPDDLYLVFEVSATGSVDEIVARDEQWHRRLLSVARPWPGLFRLSIDARS